LGQGAGEKEKREGKGNAWMKEKMKEEKRE